MRRRGRRRKRSRRRRRRSEETKCNDWYFEGTTLSFFNGNRDVGDNFGWGVQI